MVKHIEGIVIELLQPKDLPKFQSFIREHWRKDHIFVQDTSIFDFQHKSSNNYHYMIAKQHDGLLGVHGVIPQVQFDELLPRNQIFLGLWKVLDTESVGTGILLYQNILNEYDPEFIGVIGYNDQVLPFYVWQGFEVGIMNHHFVLSPDKTVFEIAKVPSGICGQNVDSDSNITYKLINESDLDDLDTSGIYLHQFPSKSDTYIVKRFMNHPVYKYHVYAILDADEVLAICVIRSVAQYDSIVLRFVDFMGANDVFALLGKFALSLLDEYKAEYLDIYSYGVPIDIIEKAGFLDRQEYDNLIIPNYFEPFERKNVDLRYAYKVKGSSDPVRLFKADGDQDRPNTTSA